MMTIGKLAKRVTKPIKTKTPQKISKPPTKYPQNSGKGNPIFSKRPTLLMEGNRNF